MPRSPAIRDDKHLSARLWFTQSSYKHHGLDAIPPRFPDKWERIRAAAKALGLSHEARNRLCWMQWYETVGNRNARATCRHFCIAPKVFYCWRKRFDERDLRQMEGLSRCPKRRRVTTLTSEEEKRICELRAEYLRYSKLKLAILYRERYGESVSSWKIQRVIQKYALYPHVKRAKLSARRRQRALIKKRITELTLQPRTGFLVSVDTIVFWSQNAKRYILTGLDRHSRIGFARMYGSHSSKVAADFLRRLHLLMDGKIENVHSDNGSEFHKYFEEATQELELTHWWSRTHTPKDNGALERFNRTLREEFIDAGNAYSDPKEFNRRLLEWLIEYNFFRPHVGLNYLRPIEAACRDAKALPMYSSHTHSCHANILTVELPLS